MLIAMGSKFLSAFAVILALVALLSHDSSQFDTSFYNGHKVYEFTIREPRHLRRVFKLQEHGLDFWKRIHLGSAIQLRADPIQSFEVENTLSSMGIDFHIKYGNVSNLLHEIYNEEKIAKYGYASQVPKSLGWDRYWSLTEIYYWMHRIARDYPHITTLYTIGKTYEGRDLKVLRVGLPSWYAKKSYFIDGGIHAREWAAPATLTWIINELVKNIYEYENLLRMIDFFFVPVLNPDGYVYSQTHERLWRKNRRPNSGSSCIGVDGNRNFGYEYGGLGSSSDPCSEEYRGPKAFSEAETRAVRDFILFRYGWRAYTTIHTYGQYILTPWGNDKKVSDDNDELKRLGDRAAAAIEAVNGKIFQVGGAATLLGPGAGGSDNWAKASGIFKWVYTYELRPSGKDSERSITGFLLPEADIIPCAQETWAGIRTMAEYVAFH